MTNETLALLVPAFVAVAMAATGGVIAWLVVKRHPAKKKEKSPAETATRPADYAARIRPANS